MSVCPECGAEEYKQYYYDKVLREHEELQNRFKRVLASHGQQRAEWDIKEISLTESMKWLQVKARKQAARITKLEDKLRKFKLSPYEEDTEND